MGQTASSETIGGRRQNYRKPAVTNPNYAPRPAPPPTRTSINTKDAPKDVRAVDKAAETKQIKRLVKSYNIRHDSLGYTYESLFSPFMDKQLTIIRIDEPYTGIHHQINNIVRFVECCVLHAPNLQVIKLVTKEEPGKQRAAFDDLTKNLLKEYRIMFLVEYDSQVAMHDRAIIFNTGILFKLGRGLDIYQRVDLKCHVGMMDYRLRKCKNTTVDVFECSI